MLLVYLRAEMLLYGLFITAIVIQGFYALYFFIRIIALFKKAHVPQEGLQGVSVIVCAKNEGANLSKNLHAILGQEYNRSFEVVVVNDASVDDTDEVLRGLQEQFDNLKIVTLLPGENRDLKGKKFALAKGVANARYSWLVFTDADCKPASTHWLELMATPLSEGKEIVAGYSGYNRRPGVLNAFARWETLHTFMQYSTYALAGAPYMAVGRNMACTKEIFFKASAHPRWNAVASGDDDMLVQVAGTADNMAVVAFGDSFTYSDARGTWKEWAAQKRRHLSTGKYYKPYIKALLGLYAVSHAVMWFCFLIMFFTDWKLAMALAGIRCKGYWLIWSAAAGRVEEKNLIILFPIFDPAWAVYNFVFLPYITWKNKQQWT